MCGPGCEKLTVPRQALPEKKPASARDGMGKRKPGKSHTRRPSLVQGEIDVLKVLVHSSLKKHNIEVAGPESVSFGVVRVDFLRHEWTREGRHIAANAREFQLLEYFLAHEGELVTRDQLLKDVWGFEEVPETRSVDNYILSVRKKIEKDAAHPKHILTFRGAGYKFHR